LRKYGELEKLLRKVATWIKSEGRKVLKEGENEITPAQFDVLQSVFWQEHMTMTCLSKRLGVAKSTVTGLVNKLRQEELVKYTVSSEDKRVRLLKITEKGEGVIQEVIDRRIKFVEDMFSDIDPYLVDEFRQVLRIVVQNVSENQANED